MLSGGAGPRVQRFHKGNYGDPGRPLDGALSSSYQGSATVAAYASRPRSWKWKHPLGLRIVCGIEQGLHVASRKTQCFRDVDCRLAMCSVGNKGWWRPGDDDPRGAGAGRWGLATVNENGIERHRSSGQAAYRLRHTTLQDAAGERPLR